MQYSSFYEYFPEIAEKETRTIFVIEDGILPKDQYILTEMYCNEPGCDCRRVFLSVYSHNKKTLEAVIAYGWANKKYYAKWYGRNDAMMIKELMGPVLNLGSPQTDNAPAILKLIKNTALKDKEYIKRIKRHYKMFRDKIEGK